MSYTSLLYHVVFSTKERQPDLTADIRSRVHEYLGGAIKAQGGMPYLVNGIEDHVHILARLRADHAVSDIMRNIKANSSGWIHDVFPQSSHFRWQEGYGAFTVSPSQKERVQQYIANQEEHHRKASFQEEFIALLQAHEIEFEEKYLWR